MAKETMQAVSQANRPPARQWNRPERRAGSWWRTRKSRAASLIAKAVKEAGKKAEVLGIVAKADGEKARPGQTRRPTGSQAQLREAAEQRRPQVLAEIRKIVLGQS